MANKNNQNNTASTEPPIDYFDLSYVTPQLTAHTLRDEPFNPFRGGGALQLAGGLLHRIGGTPRRIVFEKFFSSLMPDIETAREFRSPMVAHWFARQYDNRRYPYIILGPPLGSMAYLSCVLDAPFLPINYRMAIRHDKPMNPDSIGDYAKRVKTLADDLLPKDPEVEIVGEYDPVHERLRVSQASLLRFKFLTLPNAYVQFIRTRLAPGGAIILVESRTGWNQYKIGERTSLQVGLTSGISDEEFLSGSRRLCDFREKHLGEEKVSYRLQMRTEVAPESRFGVTPQMRAAIMNAATQLQRPVCHLFTGDIFQVNHLVSSLYLRCARREGKRPKRFFIHSGLFIAPSECMNALLLPLWVPDASFTSLAFAQQYLKTYPFESELCLLALEPSVAGPPDVVAIKKWREALATRGVVRNVGTRSKVFPYDLSTYFSFWPLMQATARRIPEPLDIRVNLDMLIEEAEKCRIYFSMYQR